MSSVENSIKLPEDFCLSIASHRQILNSIRIHKEISGAKLARLNNFQPSTLVYILRALKDRGLIEVSRIEALHKTAGKPPTLWRLAPDKGYIIGIEAIPAELRAVVVNFQGKVIHREHLVGVSNIGPENIIESVAEFVEMLLTKLDISHDKTIGVGMALTGWVDRAAGIVRYSRRLELHNFPIQERLSRHLGLFVEAVNDANAGALGIKWHEDDEVGRAPHVVFLTLNERTAYFGAGLILNHTLYEGAEGGAGEICDALPSLKEFIDNAVARVGSDHPLMDLAATQQIDIEDVIRCAQENCRLSQEILSQYSYFISEEIVRLVQLLAPNVIVLGGDLADARELIYSSIVTQVESRLNELFPWGFTVPKIHFSSYGSYAVSVGATALIMRRIFMP